jgi:hypothetical protein
MKTQLNSRAKCPRLSLIVFFTFILIFCSSIILDAQQDTISNYSSFGIFDQLTDRFGHIKTWNEVRINDNSSSTSLTSTVGMFEVHYYSGSGFENPNNTSHAERRDVVEQMLDVFNSSWNHLLSNEKIVIRFLPMDPSIAGGAAYPILGSSYYVVPKWNSNFSEVSDCLVAQYVQSSKNPYYTLGDFNTKGYLNDGAFKFSHLDFYCNLDSFVLNTDLAETSIAANQIDLYSVALREFTVALGVNSLLSKTGQGITSNLHQFSRWDSYLHFQNQPLISYDNSQKKYIPNSLTGWLSILGSFTNDCDSVFDCSQSPNIGSSALKVSISKCFNQGIDLNYLNQNCSLDTALLESNWMSGVVRRKLYSSDLQILEYLGYEMDGCFGEASYNSNFCAQFLGEHRFTRYASSTPDQAFQGIIEFDSSQKIAINKLIPNISSGISIELMDYAGGSSTFVVNNDSLEVNNFKKGKYILRFQLESSQGSHSTAFAMLGLLGGEVCEGGNCNLLSNPSFEELEGPVECGVIDELSTTNINIPYVFIDCWSAFCGSPDLHYENCTNTSFDFTSGPLSDDSGGNVPIDPDPNNDNVLFLYSRIYNSSVGQPERPPFEEAIQGRLESALIPNMTYEITMRIYRRQGGNPYLRLYFRNGEYLGDINQIINPQTLQLVEGPSQEILPFSQNEWQTWTATFTTPSNVLGLDHLIIANEVLSLNTFPPSNQRRRLFIDDVQIRPLISTSFNIPQTSACNQTITGVTAFGSPSGGTVSGPGVNGNLFIPVFAGPGLHTLTYTLVTQGDCILTSTDQIFVHPTVTIEEVDISGSCPQACNGAISISTDLNAPANVVYSWTGPSINSGNQNSLNLSNLCAGTYTLTVVINSVCTQTYNYIVPNLETTTAQFNIPQATVCNGQINSLQNFATPVGGVVSGPGVSGVTSFNFESTLAGIGTHTLTYTVTTNNGCVLTATDQLTVHPTVTFSNAIVNQTCGQSCSGSISVNASLSGPGNVVYSWTGPGINSSNQNSLTLSNLCAGSYTLTAMVNEACPYSQTYIVSSSPNPTASAIVTTDLCSGGCGNSILVTTNNPSNTISWTGGLTGFNPTNVCGGQYTATVTSIQGCSVTLTVPVSSSTPNNESITNTTPWSQVTASYNNISIGSTGYLTISGNSVITVTGIITVGNGARLYISGSTLKFAPNGQIIVQPGGRVFLEAATLTSNCPNQYWKGIEVRGSNNHSQDDTKNSMNPALAVALNTDGLQNQGGISIYKSTVIEFADVAVKLHQGTWLTNNVSNSGGYIRAQESRFRNNRRDITFSTYGFLNSNSPQSSFLNQSTFRQCTFEVNQNHYTSGANLASRVSIYQSSNILFSGCKWVNTSTTLSNPSNSQSIPSQYALHLQNASCKINSYVTGPSTFPSEFLGFVYGIRANGTYTNMPLTIDKTTFRCYRGILATAIASGSEISNCDFGSLNYLPSNISIAVPNVFINNPSTSPWINSVSGNAFTLTQGPSYGVYLNACASTDILRNNFSLQGSTSNQRVGIYVNNCGASIINVNENNFRGNSYGIRFFNGNRSTNPSLLGTRFQCNDFAVNDLHVEINAQNQTTPSMGINQNIFVSTGMSASNIFDTYQSPIQSLPIGRNIWDNVSTLHQFLGISEEVGNVTTRIAGYDNPPTIVTQYDNVVQNEACVSIQLTQSVNDLRINYLEKKINYENYKDEGDPEYYKNLIETISTDNLIARYNELIGASPALSIDRVIEVLDKENELPRSLMMEILLNNISSLKNGEALSKLDSLQSPLTVWEKDSLFASFSQMDLKAIMEIDLEQASRDYYSAISSDLEIALLDTLIANHSENFIQFNNKIEEVSPFHSRLIFAQNDFNYPLIIDLIEEYLPLLRENSIETKDLSNLKNLVVETSFKISNDSLSPLNYDGYAHNYLTTTQPLTYRMACLLVNSYDSIGFHGDLEYEHSNISTRTFKKPNENSTSRFIELYPNPAIDFCVVKSSEYDLNNERIQIFDITGRELNFQFLSRSKNEVVMDTRNIPNGTYILQTTKNGVVTFSDKIVVLR